MISGRNNRGASQLAEFAPTLYVLFIIILMPLLDLAATFVAGATQYLATNDFAAKAATQPDFSSALNSMANEAYQFQGNGLAQFVHMVPVGGYTGCGDDLFLLSTDIGSGSVTTSAPDQPLTAAINTKTSMYELSVRSEYSVTPLVSLASVPLLGDIPGLGKPMVFVFNANRPIEHPGGLQWSSVSGLTNGGTAVVPFPRVASNPATASASNITWRSPGIFAQIQAAGQTIVAINVFIVNANNSNWTQSGLAISPGEKIWIDTQAVGTWNSGVDNAPTDANGDISARPTDTNPTLPQNSLDGKVGSGAAFMVGNDQFNFPPPGSGMLAMIMNDTPGGYADNQGQQVVRVIVVK